MPESNAQPEQGAAGKPSLQTRLNQRFRTERNVWTTLLLMPLLTYCVVTVLTFSIKPVPINTGDPLYDKYLAWVAEDLVVNFNPSGGHYWQRNLGNSERIEGQNPFADWESQFRDDPRYWTMCFRYSHITEDYESSSLNEDISYLENAREMGIADATILFLLLDDVEKNIYESENFYYDPNNYNTLSGIKEKCRFIRKTIDEQVGEKHKKLLAELLEVGKDESMAHYFAALCDTQRGDYEPALVHLSNGNRAKNRSRLIGFPFENVVHDIRSGTPQADNVLSGSIGLDEQFLLLPKFINFKQMVKLLVADAVKREDRSAIDEIHTFACRYGNLDGSSSLDVMVAKNMAGVLEKEFGSQLGSSLNPEQLAAFGKLVILRGQADAKAKAAFGNTPSINPWGTSAYPSTGWALEGLLSGERSFMLSQFEVINEEYMRSRATITPIKQLLQKMESFNYNTLEFE